MYVPIVCSDLFYKKSRTHRQNKEGSSIADPVCLFRIPNPNLYDALGNMILDVYSGSQIWIFFHTGSRTPTSKSTRSLIRNTGRQQKTND